MRAIVQRAYGSIDELIVEEGEPPRVGVHDVLVRVRATSLNPDVWHMVCGVPRVLRLMGAGLRRPKRLVPGTDVAGVVEAAGPAVSRFAPGDEVFGRTVGANSW